MNYFGFSQNYLTKSNRDTSQSHPPIKIATKAPQNAPQSHFSAAAPQTRPRPKTRSTALKIARSFQCPQKALPKIVRHE